MITKIAARLSLFSLLTACSASVGFCEDKTPSEPAKPVSRTVRVIEGWNVAIDDRLLEEPNKELGDRSIRLLSNQLYQIAFMLPADKTEKLRTIKIVLDLTHGKLKPAQYHPSKEWLLANGYAEDLAKCVHLPDAEYNSGKNMYRIQPWFVLHELAHGYHDQFLKDGFANKEIKDAWKKCLEDKKYAKTLHIDGNEVRHYALTDQMEFFAEFTESYFGVNDFYPFNRAELKTDAGEIESLIRKIWTE